MNEAGIRSIFMIDDDIDDCILIRQALREISSDVELIVADGCSLVHQILLLTPTPDFILLDLNMSGLNGLECIDLLKSNNSYSKIPIFVYSTSSDEKQVKKCYEKGAKLYIQKPSSYNKIKELMKKLVTPDVLLNIDNSNECSIFKI